MSREIKSILKRVKTLVRKNLSPKSKIILFGSYAKGRNKIWSDIDVAIIVPSISDRIGNEIDIRLKTLSIDERVNPLIFSEKELNKNSPLTWEIKRDGIEI